ncbi:MAG: hypothetical protein HY717_19480 [Planctomycetes bacterium]|nr:hypothetical protein [Planctomycetota bacterium]
MTPITERWPPGAYLDGMNRHPWSGKLRRIGAVVLILSSVQVLPAAGQAVKIVKGAALPAGETEGERPYEMVRAGRRPEHEPLVSFDSLEDWTIGCGQGAEADLYLSRRQRVWDSPVARLVYRGSSGASTVMLRPPKPIPIPAPVSAASLWIYGNNWAWAPDPGTPRVAVSLKIIDRDGKEHDLEIARVGWMEWWLAHKVLPRSLCDRLPLQFSGIEVRGGANPENRELYFEDLAFFKESLEPLRFEPRPRRGIDPFPGQSPGANTGPGRLPFPTREETILPENPAPDFRTRLVPAEAEKSFRFVYEGPDAKLEYEVAPGKPFWGPVAVKIGGAPAARALAGAGPVFSEELAEAKLVELKAEGEALHGAWQGKLGEQKVRVDSFLRLWQKSLVVDFIAKGGEAAELSYGRVLEVEKPELLLLPYLNYGGHHLHVLMSKGERPFFASVWMDWYRSNASQPYAEDKISGNDVTLNGGVRYLPRTDGRRNDLFERVFVTFAPLFEETLLSIPNPPARRGKEAGSRLWQESWGPEDYQREHERSKRLRAYGLEMLTQCNHEITWRDGGESFTFRTAAAPKKGGDEALRRYVEAQRSLGWRSGLYTNYCDFAPVNEFWSADHVMRNPGGDLVPAWPRCYSPKALFAVEMDRKLAPLIQKKFKTDAAYTDVHTAVAPWDRVDYDARVPGAGTFAATFYAYGELLLHDQEVYSGHCWSEGNHQWLYAGLCAGNYGLTYSGLRLWEYPYLPHFDLLKMHPLSADIGMPWTGQFFQGKSGWDRPENIAASIDQFIAATIAYGHLGWLVEEAHGMRQTCRSYYMLQELQSRYVLEKPREIRYGAGSGTASSSEALLSGAWKGSRIYIRYANGLEVWVNGNAQEKWEVAPQGQGAAHLLPPHGWLAIQGEAFYEASELAEDGGRWDACSSPSYVFVDGRGRFRARDGIGAAGSLAVRLGKGEGELSLTAVEGVEEILLARPGKDHPAGDVREAMARAARASRLAAESFDLEGKSLGRAPAAKSPEGWKIGAVKGAIRYEVRPE